MYLIGLVDCGSLTYVNQYDVDPAFRKYVRSFDKEAERYGCKPFDSRIAIRFADPPGKYNSLYADADVQELYRKPSTVAVSFTHRFKILVKPNYFNDFSDEEREIVIFHEIGHSLYDLDHPNDRGSIMSKYLLDSYGVQRRELVGEFFSQAGCHLKK